MIKLPISHIISLGKTGSTHHRTSFRCYNAAYYIDLSKGPVTLLRIVLAYASV
jgi:hypothetical protein